MKKNRSFFAHAFVLLACTILISLGLSELMRPKFYNDNYWPLDVTYQGFYGQKNNSMEVLFLGSSHAISAFSPQELYDSCGIRSFNLSSEEQSLVVSYYWLKEALRSQSPQAVVIDTAVCFPYTETLYNCNEPSIRKAIDPMKWSSVKLEAVNAIHSLDSKETLASYLFPIIRYHARWSDLSWNDVHWWPKQRTDLRGYSILSEDCGITDYVPLKGEGSEAAETHSVMMDYLTRMHELCRENNIQLILVSTPYIETTQERHNAIEAYAKAQSLTFVDFNEEEMLKDLQFVFETDMADGGHANCFGAKKLTDKIGEILLASGVTPVTDEAYETTKAYVDRQLKNANLYRIDSMQEYLSSIDRDQYMVFANGSSGTAHLLKEAGYELKAEGAYAMRYDGTLKESASLISGSDFALNFSWKITPGEDSAKIHVYETDYERKQPGIEIVLLDREKGYVMDHSLFDETGKRIKETD